jgi:hypothetical protein
MNCLLTDVHNTRDEKMKSKEGDVRLVANKNSRKIKPPTPLNMLDPDFRKELLWIRAKVGKSSGRPQRHWLRYERLSFCSASL